MLAQVVLRLCLGIAKDGRRTDHTTTDKPQNRGNDNDRRRQSVVIAMTNNS